MKTRLSDTAMECIFEEGSDEQPKIIFCKDCKYQNKHLEIDRRFDDGTVMKKSCSLHYFGFGNDNQFCSYGEKKQ